MRFEVETGRRRRTIEVRRSGRGWTVTMDGRVMWVDFARVGDRWSMLVRPEEAGSGAPHATGAARGASYDVAIETHRQGRHLVHVEAAMSCR